MKRIALAKRVLLGLIAGIAIGAAVSEATYFFLRGGESRVPQVIQITIPRGTAEKVRRGEPEPSIPTSLKFVMGDSLVVKNEDSETHQLGPLFIPAGSSARLELKASEKYAAACSFQPGRYLGIEVQPPLTLQTRLLGVLQAGIPLSFLLILYGVFALPGTKRVPA